MTDWGLVKAQKKEGVIDVTPPRVIVKCLC